MIDDNTDRSFADRLCNPQWVSRNELHPLNEQVARELSNITWARNKMRALSGYFPRLAPGPRDGYPPPRWLESFSVDALAWDTSRTREASDAHDS